MRKFNLLVMILVLSLCGVLSLAGQTLLPPRNLEVTPSAYANWDPPGELYELIQHDGNPLNAYYQNYGYGYGVVYDVSGYTNVTLEMLDFRHSSWGVFGIWDYNLHIVDWDTHIEIATITGLQTTGDDIWEEGIDLGSVSVSGLMGVFMEPLSNDPADAYPCLDGDDILNGSSYFGEIGNYSSFTASGVGDFLMDLWIIGDATDEIVKAKKFTANFGSGTTRVASTIPDLEYITLNQTVYSRDLVGYNVYLDAVYTGMATDTFWQYTGLVVGQTYAAGVSADYDEGESEIIEASFVYLGAGSGSNVPILATELGANYPNPFNPTTTISFTLKEATEVKIDVYNITGQYVKTLINKHLEADNHNIVWNGNDNEGKSVSSGVYYYKMQAGRYTSTKKMILMK
ncbi:MAG: T9SS type A sorting domain-containing protein [Armatimonadetes bacterium]|nr:T9SS type A sorting domain-containing protein [Armatimonadota bacterium]